MVKHDAMTKRPKMKGLQNYPKICSKRKKLRLKNEKNILKFPARSHFSTKKKSENKAITGLLVFSLGEKNNAPKWPIDFSSVNLLSQRT